MTYFNSFIKGQISVPSEMLIHSSEIFGSAEDFLVWLNILNDKEVAPSSIAKRTGTDLESVNHSISRLQKNQALKMTLIEISDQVDMAFDVSPAFSKLDQILAQKAEKDNKSLEKVTENPSVNHLQEIVKAFEAEMGMITPMNMEELRDWLDKDGYDKDMILAALKEASLNRKVSLNYIRAILRRWKQDGVRTARDLEEERNQQQTNSHSGQAGSNLNFEIPIDGPWSQ